jgi:hypothetical protein
MLFLVVHTMVALSLKKHIRPVTPTTESCHSPNAKEARLFERTRSPTSSGEDGEGFESESNLSRPGSDLSSDGDDASGGSSDVGFRSGTGDIHSGSRGGVPGAVALFSAADAPLSHLLTCTEMRRSAWEEVMAVLSLYIRGKYAASVADRMVLMIEPKLACKIDMLSYEQVAMLRERAREKQQDSELSGIDEMFQRMAGIS